MYAFYVFGISDLQDLLPVILTAVHRKKKVWVAFLDCFTKKRQFYYYTKEELESFIKKAFLVNNLKAPRINFYGINDASVFLEDYRSNKPKIVFLQNAVQKNTAWNPTTELSKVVHFAWHMDSARNITDSRHDIIVNSVKFKKDLSYYGIPNVDEIPDWVRVPEHKKKNLAKINTRYFGNFRTCGLRFNPVTPTEVKQKSCFIIEAHLRKNDDDFNKSTVEMTKKLINLLEEKGYHTVWKKREKGYPKGGWYSPLDVCDAKPDVVIEKDLNFPNTITRYSQASDVTIVMNTSTAVFDAIDVSDNVIMIHPENISANEEKKYRDRYENQGNFLYVKNDWDKLSTMLDDSKQSKLHEQTAPSSLLLDYLEESDE